MTKKEFEENYSADIPTGKAMQYSLANMEKFGHKPQFDKHDTSHDVSIVDGNNVTRLGTFKHAHFAGFVEDLINAYRDGSLVWASDDKQRIAELEQQLAEQVAQVANAKVHTIEGSCYVKCSDIKRDEHRGVAINNIKADAITEENAKQIATSFFYWWYNQVGSNTEHGFDDWWEAIGRDKLREKGKCT